MKRVLIGTTALAFSLLIAGTSTAAALDESPSPSPSVSPAPSISPVPDVSASPSASPSAEPSATTPAERPSVAGLEVPTFTCDTDPSDDLVLPENTEGVTYTLEDGVFVATLAEGYEWADWFFSDPWVDPGYDDFPPGFRVPEYGPTDQIRVPVADMAFPNCNHDDETQVTLATECADGTGYLVYDIDAWWATEDTTVSVFPYTKDEALRGHDVYQGNELSGRLAWDGSTPGMTSPIGPIGSGADLPDVHDPIFSISTGSGQDAHEALVKLPFQADDPCLEDDGGNGDDGNSDDGSSDGGIGVAEGGGSDDELAATGPEAALLTAGVAALLVAAGAALVIARRRLHS
ncbi:hypothetical protein APR04_003574 [Promicromonospora umidemergens]|uniref:Gram-positive cocci surface proteins LPxTG domain-containing protein n=1 Tax=Promicromonospora umidemergens TaxID=629679 RepID=A0ABP8YCB9_9MICO|nr:hypothetical protein [Promicromonospora umidemergens]MCP2284651.1 hypothetical protein [Promicromonospora umidemergens]